MPEHGWRNVIIEVNNECNVRYDHAVLQPQRVHELITRVKAMTAASGHRLLVSTSYGGNTIPKENVVHASDYLLLHGNGVSDPKRIAVRCRKWASNGFEKWRERPRSRGPARRPVQPGDRMSPPLCRERRSLHLSRSRCLISVSPTRR